MRKDGHGLVGLAVRPAEWDPSAGAVGLDDPSSRVTPRGSLHMSSAERSPRRSSDSSGAGPEKMVAERVVLARARTPGHRLRPLSPNARRPVFVLR